MQERFNLLQIFIHWTVAAGVIALLFSGSVLLGGTPNYEESKLVSLKIHAALGVFIIVATLFRIVWSLISKQPPHFKLGFPFMTFVGRMAPIVLNAMVLVTAGTGVLVAIEHNLPEVFSAKVGNLPVSFEGNYRTLHEVATKSLCVLVCVHVLASMVHQFFLKDKIFRRIIP